MAKLITLKGKTTGAKFKEISLILNKVLNRSSKYIGIHIPPVVISQYVEAPISGNVFKFMCGVPGRLNQIAVQINTLPEDKKNVDMELKVLTGTKFEKTAISGRKTLVKQNLNIDVSLGSKISLDLNDAEQEISGVWFVGVINVKPKSMELHTMLMDNLEKMNESIAKDLASDSWLETSEDVEQE